MNVVAMVSMLFAGIWATAEPRSPMLMARCTQMHALWARYAQNYVLHHTGQRARAELALYDCQSGRYKLGLNEAERLLRREKISLPPA